MVEQTEPEKEAGQQFIRNHGTVCDGWLYHLEPDPREPTLWATIRCCRCGVAQRVEMTTSRT